MITTQFVDFRPAQVMGIREVYVCYYVLDPTTGRLKRMRVRCNRLKNRRDKVRQAQMLCAEINRRLYGGWNPLTHEESSEEKRLTVRQAAERFYQSKADGLRHDSCRGYKSKLAYFTDWCERHRVADWLCERFTVRQAADLLAEYDTNERSAYSYNNMLQFLKGMFNALVDFGMSPHNPFEHFKGKKRGKKHRTTIPKPDRKRMLNYFHRKNMPEYVVMMRLCFKHLVRPKEILMLKLRDVDFDEGLLFIPPEVSKNHDSRTIALSYDVLKYFSRLKENGCDPDQFIFSTAFRPGKRLYTTKNMFKVWRTMCDTLSMPKSYHFYSLKDTGITEMLESGMPSKFVKDLAGHHSLEMTERYAHTSDAKKILKANTVRL